MHVKFWIITALSSALAIASTSEANTPSPVITSNVETSAAPSPQPFIKRGDAVEQRYDAYTKKLEVFYARLSAMLKTEAPALFKKLKGTPPQTMRWGYQVLPRLLPDRTQARSNAEQKPESQAYSWPITDKYLDNEIPKLKEAEEKLGVLPKLDKKERVPVLEKIFNEYELLETNQQLIDQHIKHNRFWQQAIAEDKTRFQKLTELHDMVVERAFLRDRIKTQAIIDNPALVEREREREQELTKKIDSFTSNVRVPGFIKVERPRPNVWRIKAPIYTDIQDKKFIAEMKDAIERAWYLEDRETTYSLQLIVKNIPPSQLYKGKAPQKGTRIDIESHIKRFPRDGGVITTGSNSTYAIAGHYIALGPQDLTRNVIAHEFGHILGFIDAYFRGFRDLRQDGYEILEIVPDPNDIMCTPNSGKARKLHFETLIKQGKK